MAKKRDPKRREFLKKSAYAAPAILSLQATSALAKEGSDKEEEGFRELGPRGAPRGELRGRRGGARLKQR